MRVSIIVGLAVLACLASADPVLFSSSFTGNDFNDLDGWTALNSYSKTSIFSQCGSTKLVGGFNVFGAKSTLIKQIQLPPHYKIQLKVQAWKIDSWDNEKFYVYVDDKLVFDKAYGAREGEQLCGVGGDWREVRENIDITINHNGPSATVVFTSTLDQAASDESWGIRDFQLLVEKCPANCDTCTSSDPNLCSGWKLVNWYFTDAAAPKTTGWTVSNGKEGGSTCGGVNIVGGFGLYGKGASLKGQIPLPGHYKLKIKFNFWKIDSWDNERGSVSIDGKEIWGRNFGLRDGYQNNICGTGIATWGQQSVSVEADIDHTNPTADVVITSTLDQAADDEAWGVRDFFVYIATCADNCNSCSGPAPDQCLKCAVNYEMRSGQCSPMLNFILLESVFFDQGFSDLKGWTLRGNKEGTISKCGENTLVGGFNVFGANAVASKKYSFPSHKRIRIQIQLWKIDSWDGELLYINVDGGRVWEQKLGSANGGAPICGRPGGALWNELILDVDVAIPHSAPDALVEISSTLDQGADDESWGFRNFRIFYEAKPACAILFTECGYKGAVFELCADSPNFRQDNIPPQIRSVKVPPQGKVTLFQATEYGGKQVTYTTDQECIESFGYSLAELNHHTQQEYIQITEEEVNSPVLAFLGRTRD